MLKPTASYKMTKQTKRTLALGTFTSEEQRHGWKRSMIQAELASKIVIKPAKKERNFNSSSNAE
jgi:hypothetical protein